jgi:hypothetical protein
MSLREIIQYSLWFLLFFVLQILILRNIALFDYGFCFLYVGGILLLPSDVSRSLLLILGFAAGFLVDIFYNTLGMHAAATVVLAYARSFWIQLQLQTKGTTNERFLITLDDLSLSSYLTFVTPLIFLHHTTLFLIEMSSIDMLGYTMLRIVASTVFTTFLLLIIQLFSKR